jgi:hypothetical protein
MKYDRKDAQRILDEARVTLERLETREHAEGTIVPSERSEEPEPEPVPWYLRARYEQQPPRCERGLDTVSEPSFDIGEVIAYVIAEERERTTEVVGQAIGELLGRQRQELQQEIDTLRALQAEARAEQRELRAQLDVLRAERRRPDSDGYADVLATVPRRVN